MVRILITRRAGGTGVTFTANVGLILVLRKRVPPCLGLDVLPVQQPPARTAAGDWVPITDPYPPGEALAGLSRWGRDSQTQALSFTASITGRALDPVGSTTFSQVSALSADEHTPLSTVLVPCTCHSSDGRTDSAPRWHHPPAEHWGVGVP